MPVQAFHRLGGLHRHLAGCASAAPSSTLELATLGEDAWTSDKLISGQALVVICEQIQLRSSGHLDQH